MGPYFGATIETVLSRVQNTNIDSTVLGGDEYITGLMKQAQSDITGMMPYKISQPLSTGEVWGHILVSSSNSGQVAIDASQTIPQDSSNWHIFIDYDGCGIPPNNKGYESVEGTDYTIVDGVPDFAIKPLDLGVKVIANYYTTWSDNYGLEALKGILEESVALMLLENAGIADNPDLLSNVEARKTNNENSKQRLRKGTMTPQGLQQLNLVIEVETNNESKSATVSRVGRR